jgi:hypothetical protein
MGATYFSGKVVIFCCFLHFKICRLKIDYSFSTNVVDIWKPSLYRLTHYFNSSATISRVRLG